METIGHTVRELVERLERTAKARNEATRQPKPGGIERGLPFREPRCDARQAPDAGENTTTKDRAIAPRVSGMLCRQHGGEASSLVKPLPTRRRPVAANENRQWSVLPEWEGSTSQYSSRPSSR
jgi:hypothetical protein